MTSTEDGFEVELPVLENSTGKKPVKQYLFYLFIIVFLIIVITLSVALGNREKSEGGNFRGIIADKPSPSSSNPSPSSGHSTIPPTTQPTKASHPTLTPSPEPTTSEPTRNPTSEPTQKPTASPTQNPTTLQPTQIPTQVPTSDPTPKLTLSPTLDPTRKPTPRPTRSPTAGDPNLEYIGNNGIPSDAFPLKECQADCDNDRECAGDLICFQRDRGNDNVPGCQGDANDLGDGDVCVQPYTMPPTPPTPRPTPWPTDQNNPDPNGLLQFYAYYYPWYYRDDWSRHGYQDTPLLGLYGTNEVAVAEQHIEWALQTGISSWVVSFWGENHLTMKHFKAGMMNAKNFDQIKFFMLYESKILEDRGSWYDGSKEEIFLDDLTTIRDSFFDHPSYLYINDRPVVMLYITRSQFKWQEGFGPEVLDRVREKLGHDIYFIADEPFFNWFNDDPDDNQNAIVDGKQVFDAYTTYNMFVDSKVREGETATDYQLREGMPIWNEWANDVLLFPNIMPQYYDFRGHKPLLGNGDDFRRQLREVACLPKTNLNGAPNILFITSFNEWWEGTQIEPENGSSENWNNYGFEFMNALAEFKKDVDKNGFYWC